MQDDEATTNEEEVTEDPEVVYGEILDIVVSNPIDDRELKTAEKQHKALALRRAGGSYKAIAEALGYADPSGAYRAVKTAMKDMRHEGAADMRDMLLMQYDSILLLHWGPATNIDHPEHYTSLQVVMQVFRDIRALGGLDGLPIGVQEEVEGLVIGGTKDQYIEGLKKMRDPGNRTGKMNG